MGVKVTGQFEPAGDFSIVDGADVSGNITGSNISASGTVFASQFTGDGSALTGVVSGTDISGSWQGHLSSSKVTFGGDIRVAGDVVAERYVVSSSVTHLTQSFSSGSTIFGDTIDDTHKVTGSMTITGSLGVNRTVSGRGDVEIAGDYHNFPSGNGQLAILSNISASNASGSDQGGQIVFGGPISDSDLTRTFGLIGGLKENSTDGNRAGYLGFGTRRGDGDRDIHEHIKITSTGDLLFGVTNDGNKISGSSTSTGSFGEVHVADKLGIQTTTPRGPIDVLGSNGSQGFYLSSTGLKAYLPTDIAHSGGSSTFDFQVAILRLGTSTQGTVSIYPRFNSILQLETQDDTNLLTLSGSTQISGSSTSTGSFGALSVGPLNANIVTGYVGIGADSPSEKLKIEGNLAERYYIL